MVTGREPSRGALDGRMSFLVKSQHAPGAAGGLRTPVLAAAHASRAAAVPLTAHVPGIAYVTLATWLIAGAAGLFMFRSWLTRGGRDHQRSRSDGLPPAVIFTHLGLGAAGFGAWAAYVVTGLDALAWTGVGLLMPGIGLGICTVTLWTPFPSLAEPGPPFPPPDAGPGGAGPATGMLATPAEDAVAGRVSNEALAKTLSDEALAGRLINDMLAGLPAQQEQPQRKSRRHLLPLIPAGHGLAAFVTFVLAVVTAISAR
jgi:hypothetical protein